MGIHINYENYNEHISSNFGQIVCVLKGELDVVTLEENNTANVKTNLILLQFCYFLTDIFLGGL